ncbi:MAG: OmcA/MtrC family decaheme c-type cytochrome [Thiobacillaceae bacterium]
MKITKHLSIIRLGLVALMGVALAGLAGCGGGGGGGGAAAAPPPPAAGAGTPIPAQAAGANSTANSNSGAPTVASPAFTLLDANGWHAVQVPGQPVYRFTVVNSDGTFNTTLTKGSVRFALAQLTPATTICAATGGTVNAAGVCSGGAYPGDSPAQWVNYIYKATKATAPGSPGTAAGAQAWQATTESPTADDTTGCAGNTAAGAAPPAGCLHWDATNKFYVYSSTTVIEKCTNGATETGCVPVPGVANAAPTVGTALYNPSAVQRLVIQLSYTDSANTAPYAGAPPATVLTNPWYDFTVNASGNSVPVANFAQDHIVVDTASCNTCHRRLALHGGGRVDTHFCVTCHNGFTFDPNSGNALDFRTLVHKVHAGRFLNDNGTTMTTGGVTPGGYLSGAVASAGTTNTPALALQGYTIWGYQNVPSYFGASPATGAPGVGFPQDLRNCIKCHTNNGQAGQTVAGANDPTTGGPDGSVAKVVTPQGDNWFNAASREACLTCHDDVTNGAPMRPLLSSGTPASWYSIHSAIGVTNVSDSQCATCHAPGTSLGADVVHWAQGLADRQFYQYNISPTPACPTCGMVVNSLPTLAAAGQVTVTYSITNPAATMTPVPTAGNAAPGAAYNPTADCPTPANPATCTSANRFDSVSIYLGYYNLPTTGSLPDYTSYNNGGSVSGKAINGTCNAANVCTLVLALPKNTANMIAQGATARLFMQGTVIEPALSVEDHKTVVGPLGTLPVSVYAAASDVSLSGAVVPRRVIVGSYKCDQCHAVLGSTDGSNTNANAFHGGSMSNVAECPICHDVGRETSAQMQLAAASQALGLTTGVAYNESFTVRRHIHGIHSAGAGYRAMPFMHGDSNPVTNASTLAVTQSIANDYGLEVYYPGQLDDCTQCHVTPADPTPNLATGVPEANSRSVYTFSADEGPLGAVVNKCDSTFNKIGIVNVATAGYTTYDPLSIQNDSTCTATDANPLHWNVISPQAAACSACHDSVGAANHMINVGGGTFGTVRSSAIPGNEFGMVLAGGPQALTWDATLGVQGAIVAPVNGEGQAEVFEACDGCHGNTSNGQNGIPGVRVLDVHMGLDLSGLDLDTN